MTDKVEEIRKRYAFAEENKSVIRPAGFSWTIPGWQAHNDRSYLLAEVDRQRAEIERLHQAHQAACEGGDLLREEIERLREVIRTIRARCVELDDSDAVSETLDIATAALEGKP